MRIKIAIATNINFFETTLPIVLQSLLESGIERDSIFVFNGGYSNRATKVIDGITHYELDHNSFEYGPLIEICEGYLESDYWFLMHDTCKVGPRFKDLLYNIPDHTPAKLALKIFPSMSIGLYRYDYLMTVRDKIISIKNTDYSIESMLRWKHWGRGNEDYILWQTEPAPEICNGTKTNPYGDSIDQGNWYGTETIRITEYHPSLDLYKNKSNWGQSAVENMIITI